jgi:hypothetical protein
MKARFTYECVATRRRTVVESPLLMRSGISTGSGGEGPRGVGSQWT